MDKGTGARDHVTVISISGDKNDPATILHQSRNRSEPLRSNDRKVTGSDGNTTNISKKPITIQVDSNGKTMNGVSSASTVDRSDGGQQLNDKGVAGMKSIAESMMDIALLSANANQLRYLITYGTKSWSFKLCFGLVLLSLSMQLLVGIGLILRKTVKNRNVKRYLPKTAIATGVFLVMAINVLLSALTSTSERD